MDEVVVKVVENEEDGTQGAGGGATNTTKDLWSGAVATMVLR